MGQPSFLPSGYWVLLCWRSQVAEMRRETLPPSSAPTRLHGKVFNFNQCFPIFLTRCIFFYFPQCCRNDGNYLLFHSIFPLFCVFLPQHIPHSDLARNSSRFFCSLVSFVQERCRHFAKSVGMLSFFIYLSFMMQ